MATKISCTRTMTLCTGCTGCTGAGISSFRSSPGGRGRLFSGTGTWRLCLYYSWAPGSSSTGWKLTSSGYLSCSSFWTRFLVRGILLACFPNKIFTAILTGLIHLASFPTKIHCCSHWLISPRPIPN